MWHSYLANICANKYTLRLTVIAVYVLSYIYFRLKLTLEIKCFKSEILTQLYYMYSQMYVLLNIWNWQHLMILL